jgi:hypothetical protein
MSSRLDLRVAKLERAPGAGGVDVFGTVAEADANTRPAGHIQVADQRVDVRRVRLG